MDINLDELGQAVLVQIKNQVVHKIKPIADDDERELVLEFGLLEEILDFLWVVVVALSANALDLSDLVRASGCLNVLEVDFGVLAKVDDRTEVVVETWEPVSLRSMGGCDCLPSELLKDSNISINLTGPRISEYLVAIWMTIWRFWRMFTRNISCMHAID